MQSQLIYRSPDFDSPNDRFGYPFGLIIYYSWNFLATIILVNVLIALFGSAYSDVEENATDEYLAFFAHKTIDLSESSFFRVWNDANVESERPIPMSSTFLRSSVTR